MIRITNEHILLIGDTDRQLQSALTTAAPTAAVTAVSTVFDALHELNANVYTSVFVNVSPIEHRPEAATRALREAAGEGRIVLFSPPIHEPLSRKLVEISCDDYVITPTQPQELQQILAGTPSRIPATLDPQQKQPVENNKDVAILEPLLKLPLADILVDALLNRPQDALKASLQMIRQRLGNSIGLNFIDKDEATPEQVPNRIYLSHIVRSDGNQIIGKLVLDIPNRADETTAQNALAEIASLLSKTAMIGDRQSRLQKLAITDELTGIYNARYFKHFLKSICERALAEKFTVSLLLFDIDNFKKYNDTYGHGVGDQILIQTAQLMKRCSRDHDLVARISGDEFAVVFWEREGPRTPKEPANTPVARVPQTPLSIAARFQKLLGNKDFSEFTMLGQAGKGVLTISGGMAVFPWDARTPDELIDAADKALMFGAKKAGKNSIYLVGSDTEVSE